MSDKTFLKWVHNRLLRVYGERPNQDFMLKLRAIAEVLPDDQDTPNVFVNTENETPVQTGSSSHVKFLEYRVRIKYTADPNETPLHLKDWWARDQVELTLNLAADKGKLSPEDVKVDSVKVDLA